MKAGALLVVLLSNQGYWVGGDAGKISVLWATKEKHAESILVWEITHGKARLGNGRVAMPRGEGPASISITLPEVRVRTSVTWRYRLIGRNVEEALATGERTIHLFPKNLLAQLPKVLAGRRMIVWDEEGGIPRVLSQAKVAHSRIDAASGLQTARADIIVVGPDQIGESPLSQAPLLGHAQAGSSVLIFSQRGPKTLMEYPLATRRLPSKLEWRAEHRLLNGFSQEDVSSWLTGGQWSVRAILLPRDAPVLEIAYWPRETPGKDPIPIDALLVSKRVGKGRVVLCQLPLGPWQADPRSQLLLRNALEYLVTRPEPTLPPSQRASRQARNKEPVPEITIPSQREGGKP